MKRNKKSTIIIRADGKVHWFEEIIMPFVFLLYIANLILILIGIPFVFVVIYALILSVLGNSTLLCGIETWIGELFPWLLKISKM